MNRRAREILYERTYREDRNAVRDILLKYESDYDVVDDLTQEVFLRVWQSLEKWDKKSKFLTWVCAIARQVGIDHVRAQHADKRSHEVLEVYVEPEHSDGAPVPYYDRTDLSLYVQAEADHLDPYYEYEAHQGPDLAMEAMPPKMAMAVGMRRDGIPNPEIARELGVSEKTVRNLLTESRKYFRDNS